MPIIKTETDMIKLGEDLGKTLVAPITIELIGDVGAGKTTLTKGIARALGITAPITSPSFTISKSYTSPSGITLNHYDFYRLEDPGIMSEDLAESISAPSTITIIEWAETVATLLPKNHIKITITYLETGDRQVEIAK